ncbi:MAG: phosphotransferase, partial [Phycisphaerae bacterium]|nr:phosphotransferase [Phycisphaerae bacterium]
ETIPNFHNTKLRFATFQQALKQDVKSRAADVKDEIDFLLGREEDTSVLVDLLEAGKISERVTHNDTKFNNVMIDDNTDEGICVIDLDTTMPGLAGYDFGDLVRTGANSGLEDEKDLSKIYLDVDMFTRITHGYLETSRDFLTDVEIQHLVFAAKLMIFENGIRFLTDHLSGDVYFKIHREGHNLDRCRTQIKLVKDVEDKMDELQAIVAGFAKK